MAKRKTGKLKENLARLSRDFDINITRDDYEEAILNFIDDPPFLNLYMIEYLEKNRAILGLEWAAIFLLFYWADLNGDFDALKKYYKQLKNYPDNWFVLETMAEMDLMVYGSFFEANKIHQEGLRLIPDNPHDHYFLGLTYHIMGLFKRSLHHYEKAVENYQKAGNPNEIKARSLYNIAAFNINFYNDLKQAKRLLKEALKAMPDYPQALELLCKIGRGGFLSAFKRHIFG